MSEGHADWALAAQYLRAMRRALVSPVSPARLRVICEHGRVQNISLTAQLGWWSVPASQLGYPGYRSGRALHRCLRRQLSTLLLAGSLARDILSYLKQLGNWAPIQLQPSSNPTASERITTVSFELPCFYKVLLQDSLLIREGLAHNHSKDMVANFTNLLNRGNSYQHFLPALICRARTHTHTTEHRPQNRDLIICMLNATSLCRHHLALDMT